MAKEAKGTPERQRRKRSVRRIHERITNRRKDFAHKLSRRLVNEFGTIVFEDLSINRMVKNHTLAKSIADAAWNQLIPYTTYKAEGAGALCMQIDPRGPSQRCSACSVVVKKDLSVRLHQCPSCGLEMDRDPNAALNILALGLQSIGSQSVEAASLQGRSSHRSLESCKGDGSGPRKSHASAACLHLPAGAVLDFSAPW